MRNLPLHLAKQELLLARDAVRAVHMAPTLEHAEIFWRNFLNHLEKIWVKAERECQPMRAQFETWQLPFKQQRLADPLLAYLKAARDADNHSIQEVAEPIAGSLSGTFSQLTIRFTGPELVVVAVTNRCVFYDVPVEHLGKPLITRGAVALATHGSNFYGMYLHALESKFFAAAS